MKLSLCAVLLLALMTRYPRISHAQSATEIGGEKIVTLTRKAVSTTRPEFTSVSILPGRGMELLQVKANFPGKGEVDVLASPDEATAKQMLDQKDTDFGDLGYRLGAAFLVPYPNWPARFFVPVRLLV